MTLSRTERTPPMTQAPTPNQLSDADASTPEAGNAAEAIGGPTNQLSGKSWDLKPCPFCGGSVANVKRGGARTWRVECYGGCRGPKETSYGKAIEAWNRRATTQPAEQSGDTGREAIWRVVHEVWQLLDDAETDGTTGITTPDQARWNAVSEAMDKLEALVPESEGPFWGGFPVNYLWPKGAGQ